MRWWRRRSRPTDDSHERWKRGLEHERTFWESWLATDGGAWPDDFAARFDPILQLQPHVRRHLIEPLGNPVRVLDVGAGPATVLGKRLDDEGLDLIPVDPLAPFFDELLARHDVTPPVRTRTADGEQLGKVFDEASFDLAYARNSVDHSYEPMTTIRQMLRVVKPGHRIVLEHRIDEGEHERYEGLHQWNFRQEDDRLMLWQPGATLDVEEQLGGRGHLVETREQDGWIIAALERPA